MPLLSSLIILVVGILFGVVVPAHRGHPVAGFAVENRSLLDFRAGIRSHHDGVVVDIVLTSDAVIGNLRKHKRWIIQQIVVSVTQDT